MNIGKYVAMYSKDLRLKNYCQNTIDNYCNQVKKFLEYFAKVAAKPSEISERKIKNWLLLSTSVNGMKHRICAVKLFYKLTGRQPLKFKHIEYPKANRKLPIVLSREEIQQMFDVCENTKHKVILGLLYSCGLRVSELINLKWEHIDRSRMIINIIQAKGHKDRQVMLDNGLIPLLEKYFREYRSKEFVLNGQSDLQYSERSVGQVVKQLAERANVKKRVYTHLIRHCSLTHLCESGIDINLIQRIAGHNNPKTTSLYLHLSHTTISKIPSPIKNITL